MKLRNGIGIFLIILPLVSCGGSESSAPTREGKAPADQQFMKSDEFTVLSPIPKEWRESHSIDTRYYKKITSAWGIPIVASGEVDDKILRNAAELLANQLSDESLVNAQEIRNKLWRHHLKVAIFPTISGAGGTKQLPEFRNFPPAGGYGATKEVPTMGMSDLNFDFYSIESSALGNTFSHELTHSIHLLAGDGLDPAFDQELSRAYDSSIANGIWPSYAYINANRLEYLAEGAEIWFGWQPDYAQDVKRAELKLLDPELYSVLSYIYQSESLSFFTGDTSFIQPTFDVSYGLRFDGSAEEAQKYHAKILVNDDEKYNIYRADINSDRKNTFISWSSEFLYFSFSNIVSPESTQLSNDYKSDTYHFIVEKSDSETILDCIFTKDQIITETQIANPLNLNQLNSYCDAITL